MEPTYSLPELVRLQTIATTLSNEAQWAYVTDPACVDEIAEALALALNGVRDIAGRQVFGCRARYCLVNGSCQPCELNRPKPLALQSKSRPRAVLEKSVASKAKARHRQPPRRGGDAPRAR